MISAPGTCRTTRVGVSTGRFFCESIKPWSERYAFQLVKF
jgi:hypothetical protein